MESSRGTGNALQVSLLSACGSLLILATILAVLCLDRVGPNPSSFGIHTYLLEWVQAGHDLNLQGQREAHIVALLLCAGLLLTASALAKKRIGLSQNLTINYFLLALLGCFCMSSAWWWALQPITKAACVAFSLAFLLSLSKGKNFLCHPIVKNLCTILVALAGLFAVVPGLLVPYDASWMSQQAMVEFQEGYSVVSSQCDQIAMGRRIFEEVKPHYGILLPVLCGLYERATVFFSFGQNIQIVRFLTVINVIFIFAVYAWYSRQKALPLAVAFFMVLPWLHANQISILYPNLSSWRNLSFALAAVALALTVKLERHQRPFACGALSGLCLSLNQEIGVAISVGLAAFLYFCDHVPGVALPRCFLKSMAKFVCGISIFLVALYVFLTLTLGYFPNLQALAEHLNRTQLVSKSGYLGGFRIQFQPMVALVFCQYCYVLLRAAFSQQPLTFRQCFRAFAATTGLIWFAYYFNRPHEWYFQPQFFLYGFILMDMVRTAQISPWKLPYLESKIPAALLIACCVIPQVVLAYEEAWTQYRNMIKQVVKGKHVQKDAVLVSDIFIAAEAARELIEKADFLKKVGKTKKVVYLTGSTMLIPRLSGCDSKTNLADPFQELLTGKQTEDFVTSIKKSDTEEVLLDTDDCYLKGDRSRQLCWQNLEQKLKPEFVFENSQAGWKVLMRSNSSQLKSHE